MIALLISTAEPGHDGSALHDSIAAKLPPGSVLFIDTSMRK
jgi:hypothetical protein